MWDNLVDQSALALGAVGLGTALVGTAMVRNGVGRNEPSDLQQLIEHMADGVYRTSLEGKLLKANPAMMRLNGYDPEEHDISVMENLGDEWYVSVERREEFVRLLDEQAQINDFVSQVYRHRTGEKIWISESARLVFDDAGRPLHYEGTVRECTNTVRRLELEDSFRKFADHVPGVLMQARWTKDGEFTIPFSSRGFFDLIGVSAKKTESDAAFLFRMLHKGDYQDFISKAERSARELVPWQQQFRLRKPDGSLIWVDLKATPQREKDGGCLWHGFLSDISEKMLTESRIHGLAFYDPLTKLANRRRFLDQLKLAMDANQHNKTYGAVLFLDLDNFKTLNDTYGHANGDEFLVEMARRLENSVGEEGLVARFGGDEFVVLLNHLGDEADRAREIADRTARFIRKSIGQVCRLKQTLVHTSCSIGLTLFNLEDTLTYDIMRRADTAMYASKFSGKDQITFYDETLDAQVQTKAGLMAELQQAIDEDQLELNFQIQVNVLGHPVGVEALLRWNHPEKGMISPDQFIPDAEESGAIIPITTWIFTKVFEILDEWGDDPLLRDLKIAVNISPRQFFEPDFVNKIRSLTRKHQVLPGQLMLEMTEHILTRDARHVNAIMHELRTEGVRFALDDFGTGFSSLVHLRDMPFDEVKIDGRFVRDIEDSECDRALVKSIVAMADAMKMRTLTEWVETDDQREILRDLGCDSYQGYLFGPAVSRKKVETVIRSVRKPSRIRRENVGLGDSSEAVLQTA